MDVYLMNRLSASANRYQKDYRRVLCVCSAGLLRSPTAALVLASEPYNYNTRAVGLIPQFALIPVDQVLCAWADEIVCMEEAHKVELEKLMASYTMISEAKPPIVCLYIPDQFSYRDPELVKLIRERYDDHMEQVKEQFIKDCVETKNDRGNKR